MNLVPFKPVHFQTLINWVIDEDTMLKFAGIGFQYPLTEAQLANYIEKYPNRLLFLGVDEDLNPIAYGEVIPQDKDSARLGHLLIGESQKRGQGLGKQLIHLLIEVAKKQLHITIIDLFLLENNVLAQQCYSKFGFVMAANDFSITQHGKSYQILKMTMPL